MATTKTNLCSLAISRVIGDEVSTHSADGELFTATDRLNAINRARGTVYTKILNTTTVSKFMDLFPEFVARTTLSFSTSTATKPAGMRRAIKMYYGSTIIEAVPPEKIIDAEYGVTDVLWKGTSTRPTFIEYNEGGTNKLRIFGLTISGDVTVSYLSDPVDIAGYDSTYADMIEPYAWLDLIINEAVTILLATKQIG